MSPDLSVVIVNWNTRDVLLDCLRSLERAEGECGIEVIVVDNHSSDDSVARARREFPRVAVIENEDNYGFARANNIGIARATGRFIALVNSDVEVLPGCLRNLLAFMEGHPDIGMAGPRMLNPDRSLQLSCKRDPSLRIAVCEMFGLHRAFPNAPFFSGSHMNYWRHDEVRDVDVLTGCFWIVRREALARVGLLDEEFFIYGEDLDWCRRFRDAGWRVVFCPHGEAIHRIAGSSSRAPVRFLVEREKANLQYWRKHEGAGRALAYRGLLALHHAVRWFWRALESGLPVARRAPARDKRIRHGACLRWLLTGPAPRAAARPPCAVSPAGVPGCR
jgi:hypothetical protein